MVLAAFFLLAIYLDPSEPANYAPLTYGILWGYLGYSLVVGVLSWRREFGWGVLDVVTHSVDLLVFACLMFLTTGPNSPFFVYFVFILVCATFRWQWRGTLVTAAAAMAVIIVLAWYPSNLLNDSDFELNRFIIRIVYLAVIATLLGYLGAHEESLRNTLSMLTQWPRENLGSEPGPMSEEMLQHAAEILKCPRLVLAWEEEDEPWLHVLVWSAQGSCYHREEPGTFQNVVNEEIDAGGFTCRNVGDPQAPVVLSRADGLQRWHGVPLNAEFITRFRVGPVVACRLKGETVAGHLLALDKEHATADDLVLGGIVAHELATRLDHVLLLKKLREGAATDERIRLARDLHDGLLQSLTASALQLEAAQRLLESNPRTAREYIHQVQQLLASEQRDLRTQINDLKPRFFAGGDDYGLTKRLNELAERVRRQWELSCSISCIAPPPRLPRSAAREIYFVVHEALINAVRHAGASHLKAELSFSSEWVRITVTDDGKGFSFRGSFDQDQLVFRSVSSLC